MFQGPFIISGIRDLVMVEFRKKKQRKIFRPPLTDDRALKQLKEVAATD